MIISEIFKDVLPLIKKFSPSVGLAIGGHVGFVTGYIIPLLANAFSANPTDLNDIADKISTDDQAQSKLEKIEKGHGDFINESYKNLNKIDNAEFSIKVKWK